MTSPGDDGPPASDGASAFAPDAAHRLVAECVERMAVEGEGAIDAICREHPGLATTIRKRLEILAGAGLLPPASPGGGEPGIPERLGDFRLLRRLGGGGMGVVYLATQESLHREVALKLIRPEHLYFPGARERFLREVEAVARLQHPGIVPIHTVGEEAGIPFFAMERIAGASLEEVIAALRARRPEELSGADVALFLGRDADTDADSSAVRRSAFEMSWVTFCLRLLQQVADALQHAHRRGVLHRDLKPSNIMITPSGRALLLDFGLASTRGTSKLTRTGAQLGSLPYLSPEQLRGEQEKLSERTDVYALGVTLYELLTLRSPFLAQDGETTRVRILEADAIPIKQLNSMVPWDAETVCLKAMERDPARRYRSAEDLARDLDNVLTSRPIMAKRPGPWLRARRWTRRHPAMTVGLALGFLLLVPVPTALYLQQTRAAADLAHSGRIASSERDRATQQRAAADRAIEFLVDLFRAPNPAFALGHEVTAREILDRGAHSMASGFESDPLTRARLLEAIGQAYMGLGRYPEAEPFIEQALAHRRGQLGERDRDTLLSLATLAAIYRSTGRWQEARPLLERALADYRVTCGDDDRWTLRCLGDLAGVMYDLGQLDEAAPLAHQALRRRERVLGEDDQDTVASRIAVGRLDLARGDDAAAENQLVRALASCRRALGEDHPNTQIVLDDLATIHCQRQEFVLAEPLYKETVARGIRVLGETHPDTLIAMSNLASVYYSLKRLPEAEALYRQVLDRYPKVLPPDHADYLGSLSGFGLVCLAAGRVDEAQRLLEQALAGFKKLDASHPWLLVVKNNLAMVYERQQRLAEAEQMASEVLEETRRSRGEHHPDVRRSLNNLAHIQEQQHRYEAAAALYLEAWERATEDLGPDHTETVTFLKNLTLCYFSDGRYEEAEPLARELLDKLPAGSVEHGAAQRCLAQILSKLGR